MSAKLIRIKPGDLSGPRSYFTDLDPNDFDYKEDDVNRKLKLQLLTKERIIIGASSLFHDIGYQLFSSNEGLVDCIERGIIIPAIRSQFDGPEEFFEKKTEGEGYSGKAKSFFLAHAFHSVPWDLNENSTWFRHTFYRNLLNPKSLIRTTIGFRQSSAEEFVSLLDEEMRKEDLETPFLKREHIATVSYGYGQEISAYLNNYANLIYRLSGAKTVNSEGHFPQSNLTRLGVTGNDESISDKSIFWDIYVETVFSFLNSVVRLTPDRLDQLSFSDILNIRVAIFDENFANKFDEIIALSKADIDIDDPEKLILKQEEIKQAVFKLKSIFEERVRDELQIRDSSLRENALWQVANLLLLISSPAIGIIIGSLSALKAIPEITAPLNSSLANGMKRRIEWVRNYLNTKAGWSKDQRRSLLSGYEELITYGLPRNQ